MIRCISVMSTVTSSFFLSNVIDLSPLPFLMNLVKDFSILSTFSKNQFLVLLNFSILFSLSLPLVSALIFDFFPATNVGFYLFLFH